MSPELREELLTLAANNGPEWAEVVLAYRSGLRLPRDIAATGAGRGDTRNVDRIVKRIRYLLDDEDVTTGPGRAEKVAASMRSWLHTPGVSAAAQDHLRAVLARLAVVSGAATSTGKASSSRPATSSRRRRPALADDAQERELRSASGVYVFSYPAYLQGGDTATGRTRYKIGKTSRSAWRRVLDQARVTGVAEDPVLLRVYVTDEPDDAERRFHRLLDAADHARPVTLTGGLEWFETTLTFLDEIATTLGLEVKRA